MSVKVSRLANGLTVASDPMPWVETASVGVWVDVGTRHEEPAMNGVAHVLEHMAFKGTERRGAAAIAEEIEAVGGHLNAFTTREHTAYYAKVLAENVGLAVDIIADILQHSTFEEAELARERAVILQEIGQAEDTPDDIIFDHFQATAYPDQAMGRPVLGQAPIIAAMERLTVANYMKRHYGGEGMVLAAAGRVDHDELVGLARRAFADLEPRRARPEAKARYGGGEFREERDLEQVHVVLGFDGVSYHDRDHYAVSVFSTALGGGMSSRLFQEVREKRGLVYSIYSFGASYTDSGVFGIYAGTGENEVEAMIPVICAELGKLKEDIGEAELARARAQLRAGTLMARESTSARLEQLAQSLLVYGRPIPVEEIVAEIDKVDRGRFLEVARRLSASPITMAALGPIDKVERASEVARRMM